MTLQEAACLSGLLTGRNVWVAFGCNARTNGLMGWALRSRKLVYIRAAGPLTVTILSIAICNIFHLNRAPYNIRVVGTVPAVRHHPTAPPYG